ncbi:hypothetical protein C8F01DRAFT_761049 [Mycena amicta]|nr:hypothetical protein C8F01DRAFT_761049 [Mycena amicta]
MHPAFDLKALEKLPVYLQKPAKTLAALDVSRVQTDRFAEFKVLGKPRGSEQTYLLPVWWRVLDPSGVPPEGVLTDDLDLDSPQRTFLFRMIFVAIFGICSGDWRSASLSGAYREIWHRVWPWIQHIQAHYDLLPAVCRELAEELLPIAFLDFSVAIFEANMNDVWKQPGFLAMVLRAWGLVVTDGGQHFGFLNLLPMDLTVIQLEDALQGVDGTLDGLARLIAQHVTTVAGRLDGSEDTGNSFDDIPSFNAVIRFIIGISKALVGHGRGTRRDPGPFIPILATRLRVTPLTDILRQLGYMASETAHSLEEGWQETFGGVLLFLTRLLTSRKLLSRALRQDLIQSIARCCQRGITQHIAGDLEAFILLVLQPATLLSSTNALCADGLRDAQSFLTTRAFRNSKFITPWDIFYRVDQTLRVFSQLLRDPRADGLCGLR